MEVEIKIKAWVGNTIRFDYCNDGTRLLLDKPYQHAGKNAHFILPNGKKRVEYFSAESTNEDILIHIARKYSNFEFKLVM